MFTLAVLVFLALMVWGFIALVRYVFRTGERVVETYVEPTYHSAPVYREPTYVPQPEVIVEPVYVPTPTYESEPARSYTPDPTPSYSSSSDATPSYTPDPTPSTPDFGGGNFGGGGSSGDY